MTEGLTIRPYRSGDEAAIVTLFQPVFGQPMSPAYWQWCFGDNPTRQIMIDLAWDGSVLAGHYAVSPVVVCVEGQECLTGHSMTTMTHPDYRGRGLFVTLAESVYSRMSNEGVDMVWGFPNIFSHRGFVRDLAWADIHEVPTFKRVLSDGKPMPEPSTHVRELVVFDARFDQLWDEVKGRYRILTKRDTQYLSWRYGANPSQKYTVLGYVQGDRLLGYAIWKRYQNVVDLVDVLSVDDVVSLDLLYGVAQWAAGEKAEAINIWLNFTLPLHRELEKLGFRNSEPITYFGARLLRSGLNEADIYSFKNWYLTMGDSDVY